MSVPIRTEPTLSAGEPAVLLTFKEGEDWDVFDVSPDGKRFLAVVPGPEARQRGASAQRHPELAGGGRGAAPGPSAAA